MNELTLTPLIETEVTSVKLVPVIVTKEPPVPLAGVKLLIVGAANADPVNPIKSNVIISENCIKRFIGNSILKILALITAFYKKSIIVRRRVYLKEVN